MYSKLSTAFVIIISILLNLFAINPLYGAVVWSEEFDGPSIDKSKWTYDTGNWGFGNGELQYYTARPENAYIENGSLVIKAMRENYKGAGMSFTSSRLKTQGRFAFKYGTIEARIKVPDLANGLWPAFWMLGNNIGANEWPRCGELDILEMGMKSAITAGLSNKRHSAYAHWYDNGNVNYGIAVDSAVNLNEDYHLYKLSWTPTLIKAYIDGVEYWAMDITAASTPTLEEFHKPFFIIANLAVGGWNFVEISDPGAITAPFPAKMYVDWIRVSSNASTELYYNDDNMETGDFGVFTETTPVENHINFGTDAELYIWHNMTASTTTPYEGSEAWSFDFGGADWFGMGVLCSPDRNMTNYSDGFLHFNMKTTSTTAMKVGIKSSASGESWLPLIAGGEFGSIRDGNWHEVAIPLNRFANIDFGVITQIFMFASSGLASSAGTVSIDNVYWTPSIERPTPANGSFGVLTETESHKTAGEFLPTVNGDIFVWESTLVAGTQHPYEGSGCLSFTSAAGQGWFGAAITPNIKYNLTAFGYPESKLHFAMKTSSTVTFMIGMKSGNVEDIGQKWITFAAGSDPYGFARDGQWHVIEIPMADISNAVDLSQVSQLFELLGTSGPITGIEIDDICFIGGGSPISGGNAVPTISITSPTDGQIFNVNDDITIQAEASDSDGTITKVEFYNGTTLIGQDLTSPYSFTWNDVAAGTYLLAAKATDNNDATRSASVRVYVGQPVLTSISVSPGNAMVQIGQTQQFTASGLNQFGLPIGVNPVWSVTGGGTIDAAGLFTATAPGSRFKVSAQQSAITGNANFMTYFEAMATGCTGGAANGDYTYEVTNTANPTITFLPGRAGVGSPTCILYYNTSPYGVFPGQNVSPNVPFSITAAMGQPIYFYYTYSIPEGGQRSTENSKHDITVGGCGSAFPADLTGDEFIDFDDFYILASYWLENNCNSGNANCSGADYQPDGSVNMKDLKVFADDWLE